MKSGLLLFFMFVGSALFAQNYSLSFNGSSFITVPDSPTLNPSSQLTLEVWIKTNQTHINAGIAGKWNSTPPNSGLVQFVLQASSSSHVNFIAKSESEPEIVTVTSINDNIWHHIAGVFTGDSLFVYQNGVRIQSKAYSGVIPSFNQPFEIGRYAMGIGGSQNYFSGLIDDVRLWNRALSPAEINSNMYSGLSGSESGLLAYWDFNEGSGSVVLDKTTNHNDGTNSGATYSADAPTIQNLSSIHFDGIDDYIEIPHNSSLDFSQFTVEAWFKWNALKQPPFIISKDDGNFEIHLNSDKWVRFQPTAGSQIDGNINSIDTMIWTHIACVYNPTNNTGKTYINGIETGYQQQTGLNLPIAPNSSPISIGRRTFNSNPVLFFNGNLDEIRIWNYALSQAEIQTNMNIPLTGSETGLAAYYDFNEVTGSTVFDKSPNGNNGTIHGATYSTDVPGATPQVNSEITFTNVTSGSGTPDCFTSFFQYIDYNNDQYPDIFVKDPSTYTISLYKNNGNFTFSDVTSSTGFSLAASNQLVNNNFHVADFNKDGWQDVLTYDFTNHKLVLLINENGNFSDQSVSFNIPQSFLPADVNVEGLSTTVADFDRNGFLDFAFGKNDATTHKMTAYCLFNSGTSFSSPIQLFQNSQAEHKFILQAIDYDLDSDEALLVLDSDFSIYWSGQYYNHPMRLFVNTGGIFSETTIPGLGTANQDDFALIWDYNNDGYPDFTSGTPDYVANEASIVKSYRNNGGLSFTDVTSTIQINQGGGQYILFNSAFDIDQDGDQDYVNEGAVFLNNLVGAFTHSPTLSAAILGVRQRINAADLDNDGDLDLMTLSNNDAIRVIKNESTGTHFLKIKLTGTQSPKEGQGAYVKVKTTDQSQFQYFYSNRIGTGPFSSSAKEFVFGLGSNTSADSVIVYWPSGEKSGLANVTANQILTITEPEGQPLNQNYSLNFNGSSDKVIIPASSSQTIFGANQPSTLSLWVKFNRVDVEQTLFFKGIVSGNPELGNKYYGLSLQQPGYHRLTFSLYNGGTQNDVYSSSSFTVEPNVWYNVVVVRAAEIKMFVNGVDVSSGSNNAGWNTDYNSILSDKDIYLGTTHSTDPDYSYLDGKIEDVQLWSKALTQTEIQSNMSSVLTGNEANLVAHWNFNEGTGSVVLDKTSNDNDGTNSGAIYSTDIPNYIPPITVTDIDGNVYNTVKIGNQTWTTSNLKVTKYNDGTSIPNLTDGGQWASATSGAYSAFNNDQNNVTTYGYLYNWYAVNTEKLAPAGWHVASDAEWKELTDYLGGTTNTGTILKAKNGWSPNTGTDDYGFSALPGGYRFNEGGFYDVGNYGGWWSSTPYDTQYAWRRYVYYSNANVFDNYSSKRDGFSVRLVKDSIPPLTVTDIDGNIYNTTKIGNQIWTTSNLKVTKYNDGTPIPNLTDGGQWVATTNGAYCSYNNDQNNVATYGYLYNWHAVNTGKLAPEGWHVPSDEEWDMLMTDVGGEETAGTKLKAPTGWNENGNGTDDFSFTALPGGDRSYNGGFFIVGSYGFWWSSSSTDADNAGYRLMNSNSASVPSLSGNKREGISVRLVKDVVDTTNTTAWRMQIKGSISGSQDFENFAGVSDVATNTFDASFDTPEPPTNPGNYISVYFPHPEWNNVLGNNFTNDIRTTSDLSDSVSRWYFEVKSNVLNQDVTLNFQNDRIPAGYGRYLTDLQNNQRVDLSAQNTFIFTNTSETSRKFMLVIGDSTSPALSILTPKSGTIWQSGKTKTLNWSGSDGTGIDSVKIYYSANGTVFNLISSTGNQTTYDWTVPSNTLNHLNKIKVVAIDSVGNQKAITTPFFTISGDSLVTTVSAGWNLLSLPLEPKDSSKSKIVGDDFGSAPYYLWAYSGQNGYQEAQFLHSGTGFWLGALSARTVDVSGSVLEADSIIQQLTPGYNLIGNQFVKAIAKSNLFIIANGVEYSFASAIDNNLIGSVIYGFDGTTYQESDTLSLFKGYWILALTDQLSLVQKVKVGSVPLAKRLAKTSEMQESDWMMDIAISSAGKTYQPVTFGTNLAATENFDNEFDNPLPPKSPASNYVDSWFELAGSFPEMIGNRFKRDITDNLSLSWNLNVETNQSGSYTLSWNPEVASSDPYLISLSLKNMSNDEIIDMLAETEYTTEITGSVTFSIIGVTNSSTVPVELVSFTGENSGRKTILSWQTKSETNNSGWEVERKTANSGPTGSVTGVWEKLGFIAGKGTTSEPSSYSFSALGVAKSSIFRLKQIDLDGKYAYSKSIEVEGVKIEEFKLYQNYPNPFNPTTVISFNLAKAEKVELKVFDMLGREVKTLINNESKSEGLHQITFDASTLSNGIYFYQITAGSFKQNKKMLLVK